MLQSNLLGDIQMKFEMLDLFLIAMLMVAVFFGLAMLSLHGMGHMTCLAAAHGA